MHSPKLQFHSGVSLVVAFKSILCIWTCVFMVLPGCLCQVLEPMGIHVLHHHHGVISGWGYATNQPPEYRQSPPQPEMPGVPCHCDERPDRDTDDSVAVANDLVELPSPLVTTALSLRETLAVTPCPRHQMPSRAPPPGRPGTAMMRALLCVYLV